jgi:predicted DNA-binding transcriptional regulator AlpA
MSINSDQDSVEPGGIGVRQRVSISRWVNEPYPAWDRILTAHDVARLIRRPPWMLCSMAAIGQFPKRQRFRGKNIGWLRADILDWMARSSRSGVAAMSAKTNCCRRRRSDPPGQQALALKYPSAHAFDSHSDASPVAGGCP